MTLLDVGMTSTRDNNNDVIFCVMFSNQPSIIP